MPTRQATTSAARKELGDLLRRLRGRRGLTGPQVAEATGIDPGTLSRYEKGHRRIEPPTVRALLDLYNAEPSARETAAELWQADSAVKARPAWWRRGFTLPEDFGQYLADEQEARRIRSVELHLPPGRLQTEDVATAVIAGMRPDLTRREVTGLVDLRMRRQVEALGAEQDILLGPSVLALPGLAPGAVRRQLERILEAAQQPGITLRVLPPDLPYHPGLAAPFVLMDPPVGGTSVWVELLDRSVRLPDTAVERYEAAFATIAAHALTVPATLDHLTRLITERT
ncbi:helix-turn-helix transcriptional regulator [Streptomyces sp. BE20]|uniref:helix-turn-helix domain-containing protein n=1 Tax=Streptomyces sp. BE20 TaxID=3002525 RepID=UPI002E7AAE8D|nr:helix-turn-helix transcriptional regulator [Streptomyces sp. BE20]MEE1820969.1 helix-turn-helix transcriptional regulator [Streptomyces sp. BE20]